jgi:hypothetical protein
MRCVQQVAFLRLWERLRGSQQLPHFSALTADDVERSNEMLSLVEVVATDTGPRFRVIRNGLQFNRMYTESRSGQFLDDYLPPHIRSQALESHRHVVEKREPCFSLSNVRNNEGPIIRYERLVLPFTLNGPDVERVATVITIFSEENGFDLRDVMNGQIIDQRELMDQ